MVVFRRSEKLFTMGLTEHSTHSCHSSIYFCLLSKACTALQMNEWMNAFQFSTQYFRAVTRYEREKSGGKGMIVVMVSLTTTAMATTTTTVKALTTITVELTLLPVSLKLWSISLFRYRYYHYCCRRSVRVRASRVHSTVNSCECKIFDYH